MSYLYYILTDEQKTLFEKYNFYTVTLGKQSNLILASEYHHAVDTITEELDNLLFDDDPGNDPEEYLYTLLQQEAKEFYWSTEVYSWKG